MKMTQVKLYLLQDLIGSLRRKKQITIEVINQFVQAVETLVEAKAQDPESDTYFNELQKLLQERSAILENVILRLSEITSSQSDFLGQSFPILAIEPAARRMPLTPAPPAMMHETDQTPQQHWSTGDSVGIVEIPMTPTTDSDIITANDDEAFHSTPPRFESTENESLEKNDLQVPKNFVARLDVIRESLKNEKPSFKDDFESETTLNVDAPVFKPNFPTHPPKLINLAERAKQMQSSCPDSPMIASAEIESDGAPPSDLYNNKTARSRTSSHSTESDKKTDNLLKSTVERLENNRISTMAEPPVAQAPAAKLPADQSIEESPLAQPSIKQSPCAKPSVTQPSAAQSLVPKKSVAPVVTSVTQPEVGIDWKIKSTPGRIPNHFRKRRVPPLWKYVRAAVCTEADENNIFYIQLCEDEKYLESITDDINKRTASDSNPPEVTKADIEPDLIVTAPFGDMRYRARVERIKSDTEVEVFFVDYGNSSVVKLKDIQFPTGRQATRLCQMAVACELAPSLSESRIRDMTLPDMLLVCLGEPRQTDSECVYPVVDFVTIDTENALEPPQPDPVEIAFLPGKECSVLITHLEKPDQFWAIKSGDLGLRSSTERILQTVPPIQCSKDLIKLSTHVAYDNSRTTVTRVDEVAQTVDLFRMDYGDVVENVPMTDCRRLPVRTLCVTQLARPFKLANCKPKDAIDWQEPATSNAREYLVGRRCFLKTKENDPETVVLFDEESRKYIHKELRRQGISD